MKRVAKYLTDFRVRTRMFLCLPVLVVLLGFATVAVGVDTVEPSPRLGFIAGGNKVVVYNPLAPADPGTIPTDPGTSPNNPGAIPTDPGTTPTEPGTTPTNPGTTPTEPGTTPTNPGTTPTEPGTTPTEGEEVVSSLDGKVVGVEAVALDINGKTYVPIRAFAKVMGYIVEYDGQTNQLKISNGLASIQLKSMVVTGEMDKELVYFNLNGVGYTSLKNFASVEGLTQQFDSKTKVILLVQGSLPAGVKLTLPDQYVQELKQSVTKQTVNYMAKLKASYDIPYYKPFVNPYVPYTYQQMLGDAAKLQAKFPDLISVGSAGKSVEGRDILTIEFGKGKKNVYLFGSHHAREYISTAYLMKFINETAYTYETGNNSTSYDVEKILNQVTYHIIPMVNPDGVHLVQNGFDSVSPEFRDKVKSYPIVQGKEYSYQAWKANINGVDINRNYPVKASTYVETGVPASAMYQGATTGSEPETQAVMNYLKKFKPDAVVGIHSQGQLLYWTNPEGKMGSIENRIIKASGYQPINNNIAPKGGYLSDYVQEVYNVPAYTVELCQYIGPYPYPDAKFDTVWKSSRGICLIVGEEIGKKQ